MGFGPALLYEATGGGGCRSSWSWWCARQVGRRGAVLRLRCMRGLDAAAVGSASFPAPSRLPSVARSIVDDGLKLNWYPEESEVYPRPAALQG